MVDFHSHILPEMDDGSSSPEESLKMLEMSARQGIDHIFATSHFYPDEEDPSSFLRRRAEAYGKLMAYIGGLFGDSRFRRGINGNFTLQNGEEKLRGVFSDVRRLLYEDSLEVTRAEDMADYIFSLEGMADLRRLPRKEVLSVLEKHMTDGVLRVPKEYGMFIAEG